MDEPDGFRSFVSSGTPTPPEGDSIGSTVENLGGGSGNDDLTGDFGPNVIYGNGGNDDIDGSFGNDRLYGDGRRRHPARRLRRRRPVRRRRRATPT